MTYTFPEELGILKTWMAGRGVDLSGIFTERQAAFRAQRLAGTRFKFPQQGASCRKVLLNVQKQVVKDSARRRSKLSGKKGGASRKVALQKATYAGITVFTDGACVPNPGRGGWAYVVYREGEEFASKCGGDAETTNNRMELEAMGEALVFISAHPVHFPAGTPITVYTDIEYAAGVSTGRMKAKAHLDVVDCIRLLLKMMPAVKIELVRGHSGERGNERADELAEQGRLSAGRESDQPGIAA
ncbi:MAG TPA: RNase H family protein [Ramlibacter sp.]